MLSLSSAGLNIGAAYLVFKQSSDCHNISLTAHLIFNQHLLKAVEMRLQFLHIASNFNVQFSVVLANRFTQIFFLNREKQTKEPLSFRITVNDVNI